MRLARRGARVGPTEPVGERDSRGNRDLGRPCGIRRRRCRRRELRPMIASAGKPLSSPSPFEAEQAIPLGEQLVRAGHLAAGDLEAALSKRGEKRLQLGEILLEMGFLGEEILLPFLARQMRSAAVRLREGLVDPQVVRLIPRTKAEALCVLAM